MAKFFEPTQEQIDEIDEWIATRPPEVQEVARRFKPWNLYRLKDTNDRVMVLSFDIEEDGAVSMTVMVSTGYNFVVFPRKVFGIRPDDLEECDLPEDDELVGTFANPKRFASVRDNLLFRAEHN